MTTNDTDDSKSDGKAYRDGETLRELYHERAMGIPEIANHFGVADSTIFRWIERNGIDTRVRGTGKQGYVSLDMDGQGYERWKDRDMGDHTTVRVHQLLAIAEGASPYDVFGGHNHIHHRNGIPWDNRPENIELLTAAEHASGHSQGSGNTQSILTEEQVRVIKGRIRSGESNEEVAADYPVSPDGIKNISIGRAWTHVE